MTAERTQHVDRHQERPGGLFRILLIEDHHPDAEVVRAALEQADEVQYHLVHVSTLAEARLRLREDPFDAVLLDLTLPDGEGLEPFLCLHDEAPTVPIVVLTGIDDRELSFKAVESGAQDYLVKARVNAEVISRVVRYAISRKRVEDDLKLSQEQLLQAQKMEGMGQLAGGIAHDFNNLLTSILGFAYFINSSLEEEHSARQDVQEIIYAGERAASLTRQLLAFSRREILQARPLNLNDVVEEMDQILRRTIGEDLELLTLSDDGLGSIVADISQIEQIIMNLAVNARDAMPRGGRLILRTGMCELDEHFCRRHDGLEPGSYVCLSVRDTGVGMTEEVRRRAFEPFFTTKGVDKGTGLGLSSVYGIVKQSNGHIEIETGPDQGTEFSIYFPMVDVPADPTVQRQDGPLPKGHEWILLVEDEDTLRHLAAKILTRLGYQVIEACNGAAALEIMANNHTRLDLVLTDVVMPQMGGPEMVQHLQSLRDGFRVMYVSGFADDRLFDHGIADNEVRLLKKPYSQEKLAVSVREVLDAAVAQA